MTLPSLLLQTSLEFLYLNPPILSIFSLLICEKFPRTEKFLIFRSPLYFLLTFTSPSHISSSHLPLSFFPAFCSSSRPLFRSFFLSFFVFHIPLFLFLFDLFCISFPLLSSAFFSASICPLLYSFFGFSSRFFCLLIKIYS